MTSQVRAARICSVGWRRETVPFALIMDTSLCMRLRPGSGAALASLARFMRSTCVCS
jgi:hypothetical protein